ncbi:uncharacterized protein H6S33_010254 [Morchella sextelata]|uniref:uncharacterized protein n=1 Tax=Morchella sextelata TaxID=1174677 RepID=UPI001D052E23|nr:uncharacterized protein H6S33_010254 [Morchella sextelata]KAH0612202.1 hypothetical protein H6S33_010254 [Morchella sextelata]
MKYYAVRTGFNPGIYTSWKDCLGQITGFKGAKFKSFPSEEEAQLFLSGTDPSLDPASSSYTAKFYGVRSGKTPGVYTDWASAEQQVVGVQKPKVRCFPTREEAEAFVNGSGSGGSEGSPVSVNGREKAARNGAGESVKSFGRDGSSSDPEQSTPALKKRKSVGNNLVQQESVSPVEHMQHQQQFPSVSLADPREENDGSTSEEAERKKPKPRVTAKKNSILRIYTDGSALGNGRDTAMAGVGVWFGDRDARNISEPLIGPRQTNQRAELTAILRAINVAPLHREVLIYTDSKYAINCVTVWHINWIKNNWITSVGRPVENQDLIEKILEKVKERVEYGSQTRFEWVQGHTGHNDGNSQADKLAVEGARMARAVNRP